VVVPVGKAPALSDPQQGFLRLSPQGPSLVCFSAVPRLSPQDRHLERSDSMQQLHRFALNLGQRRQGGCRRLVANPLPTALQRANQADDRAVSAG
jgi:hypothetical protein